MARAASREKETVLERTATGELVDLSELPERERVISAEALRAHCLDTTAAAGDPRGIRLKGATIEGRLDLSYSALAHPLSFVETTFFEPPCFDHASLPALSLKDCRLPGLDGAELNVAFDLDLSGSTTRGELVLHGARIDGRLICDGTKLTGGEDDALYADNVRVAGRASFGEGFEAKGTIRLPGAVFGGNLELDGAKLDGKGAEAFYADGVEIGGSIFLRGGFRAVGEVRILFGTIRGRFECDGSIDNEDGDALSLDGVAIGGEAYLSDGFSARGAVRLNGAKIGRTLSLDRAKVTAPGVDALAAENVDVGGDAFLRDFRVEGTVRLLGTMIKGNLELDGARLAGADGLALYADNLEVGEDLLITRDFEAVGAVHLFGVHVKGSLICVDTRFANPEGAALTLDSSEIDDRLDFGAGFSAEGTVGLTGTTIGRSLNCSGSFANAGGYALIAENAEIRGGLDLDSSFRSAGTVRLRGATIARTLNCDGARLDGTGRTALDAENIHVGADVFFREGFAAHGEVRLLGAMIKGNLECDGGSFAGVDDLALLGDNLEVGGNVFLREGFVSAGTVRLAGASIGRSLECQGGALTDLIAQEAQINGTFVFSNVDCSGEVNLFKLSARTLQDDLGVGDPLGSWAGADPLVLEGFAYDRFVGPSENWRSEGRFRWLQATESFDPGSWHQLIEVYRAHGEDDEARRTAIAMENDRLRRGGLSLPRRIGRWILRITIGHGYRPWLALVWAVAIVVPFALLVSAAPADTFVPTTAGAEGSPQPLVYALDTFLPIVDLGEADQWTVTGRLQWAAWAVILLGWTLSTIFVAGFTRIVRNV